MLSTCQKKPAPTPKHPTSKKNDIPTAPAEPLYKASGQPMPDKDAAKEQPRNSKTIRRWKLILALFLPNFLASLDVTIVAPAIPAISSHFDRLTTSFNSLILFYTLPYTTFFPSSGHLADIYGRHFTLQLHILCILLGTVLCAAATSWAMLLAGRAFQGVGASGVQNLTVIVLADGVSLADNAVNNTIFMGVFGISYALGPVLGGYLAQGGWRWCFLFGIPPAVLSHILLFSLLRKDLVKGRVALQQGDERRTGWVAGLGYIDWVGIATFMIGLGLVILAVQWGGTVYPWNSAAVIASLVVGGILLVLFSANEHLLEPGRFMARRFPACTAMMASSLFHKRDTSLLMIINFSTGVSFVCAFYFVSYYWQLGEGYSSSRSGLQLLCYLPGLASGIYGAMFLCNVWPRQTFYPLVVGAIIELVALAGLTWAIGKRSTVLVNVLFAVAGVGTGLRGMPVTLHAAGIWPSRMAAVQSALGFVSPLGETVGISMMGSVFTNQFSRYVRDLGIGGEGFVSVSGPSNLDALANLAPTLKEEVRDAAARAVMWAFVSILPFMALSVVASVFLGNVWIGSPKKVGKDGVVKREETKGMVMTMSYAFAACAGGVERNRVEEGLVRGVMEAREREPDVEASIVQTAVKG